MLSRRFLSILLVLLGVAGLADAKPDNLPQSSPFSIRVGLISDEAILIKIEDAMKNGFTGPVVELDLSKVAENGTLSPAVDDAMVRVEEWSGVTLDFGELDFEDFRSTSPAKSIVEMDGKMIPIFLIGSLKPVFFSLSRIGGEPIFGKMIRIDQVSCELYSTSDSKDKLSCEGHFEVKSDNDEKVSFAKFYISSKPSGHKLFFALRSVKFKIDPGVRVSGVSYLGFINLNIKSL